ncbi:MAG: hypothetical protein OMM_04284 [Candidatus Magnetoglobus multicellularis str. Araruama]|uniref:AAA+ ATPase domain-containing protein n=1 Tax=Candidatus Magnetoglobus multicellularis str. Araruama TaxID=890399 RepID=A0A1V1P278_9BACT|nr:MAG: hypothetical protein OMM_04284 [Candidatus Magnetoglobus multicellularis str. Araruama]
MDFNPYKRVEVECEFDKSHIIETNIEKLDIGSILRVYCPYCGKWGNGTIKGFVNDKSESQLLQTVSTLKLSDREKFNVLTEDRKRSLTEDMKRSFFPKKPPVIKIQSIKLENIGIFKSLNLDFNSQCSVIIGPNGRGKTTILRAIILALIGYDKNLNNQADSLLAIKGRKDTKCEWESGKIQLSLDIDGEIFSNKVELKPDLKGEKIQVVAEPMPGIFDARGRHLKSLIIAFGQNRVSCVEKSKSPIEVKLPKIGDLLPLLNNDNENRLLSFASWVAQLDYKALKGSYSKKNLINKAFEIFSDIAGEKIEFDTVTSLDPLEIWVKTKDSRQGIPLELTSMGYQMLMSWVGYLLQRMYEANNGSIKFYESHCIVFIDEIDLFLHPIWQQKILSVLRKFFPNTQFIVTTHSPLVVDGLDRQQIIQLKYKEDTIVAESNPVDIWAWNYNDILERFFHTFQNFSEYEENILPQIKELQNISERTQEQEDELERLESILHRLENSRAATDEIFAIKQRLENEEQELFNLLQSYKKKAT